MTAFTQDTPIRDVLTACQGAVAVFERHGLACGVCMAAEFETLASVATMHEISVDALLADLNSLEPECEEA